MKKMYFPFVLFFAFLAQPVFAQTTDPIPQITKCILSTPSGLEENCFQEFASSSISVDELIGNWLFLGEQGDKQNAMNPYQIVPLDHEVDLSKPFPEGCSVLMTVKKLYAIQSKTCAPSPGSEQEIPDIQSIAKFNYRLTEPGMLELIQIVKNNYTTANCSLLWISNANYLVCTAIEKEISVKSVAFFKKS